MKKSWKIILVLSLAGNLAVIYTAYKALEYRRHINFFLEKYTYLSEEFSGRSYYEQANKRIKAESITKPRVVFLGTQVIENWDLKRDFSEIDAINRGISGQRAAGYLLRFRPDVIDLKPVAVVIEISSYNLRPINSLIEFQDYISCLAELSRFNKIEPILTTIIPTRADFVMSADFENNTEYKLYDSIAVFNEWLSAFCDSSQFHLVDFHNLLSDSTGCLSEPYSANTVEPNRAGYVRLAEAINQVLERIIKQRGEKE